jgi:alpha-tubulin suppressor-like RCC1 family protein
LSPTFIVSNVDGISAGLAHSLFVRASDDSLWAMGDNAMLQIGDGSSLNRFSPVQVGTSTPIVSAGYDHSMFIAPDATLWTAGDNRHGQMGIGEDPAASPWKRVNIEALGL